MRWDWVGKKGQLMEVLQILDKMCLFVPVRQENSVFEWKYFMMKSLAPGIN